MTLRAFHAACVFLCAALLTSSASAYQVSKTSRGVELKWSSPGANFAINASAGPSGAAAAIRAGMETWNAAEGSEFAFSYDGTTSLREAAVDGINVCCFNDLDDDDTLAYNSWWYNPSTGEILESDVVFNTAFAWSTAAAGVGGKYDLQSIATHELGHALSLDDLYGSGDVEKTMYGITSDGETKKRSLHADDIAGIGHLYPAKSEPPNLTPYQPAGWGHAIVVATAKGTVTDSATLYSSDTLYVDWAVQNQGEGKVTSRFYTALYVDGELLESWYPSLPFMAGDVTQVNDVSIGSLSPGAHTLQIVTDMLGAISESDESDNVYARTVTVVAPPLLPNVAPFQPSGWSDRIVVASAVGTTTSSPAFYTSDTLYVDWAVRNGGTAGTTNLFQTTLYVDGAVKATWHREAPLGVDANVTVSDYPIGALSAGSHTLRLVADSGGAVAEGSEADNAYERIVTVRVRLSIPTLTVGVKSEVGPVPTGLGLDGVLSAKVASGKLPPGMALSSRGTGLYVTGVPSKAGRYAVVVQPSLKVGAATVKADPVSLDFTVEALSASATGVFNGWLSGGARGPGLAQMSVSALGRITGKLSAGGTNFTFSATSFSAATNGGFSVQLAAKSGKATFPLRIDVSSDGLATWALPDDPAASVFLFRNTWSEPGMAATLAPFIGYYTATLPGTEAHGSGYLAFTADAAGRVKVGGKLADGTAVSLSGTLLLDGGGRLFAVVYAAPSAYKGGSLFGLAEFVAPAEGATYVRLLDGEPVAWQSRNPQATGSYGEGFARELGLVGGWYSKTGDLSAYYAAKNLSAAVNPDAYAPELTLGAVSYESVWWDPSGIALAPTLKSGVMAGIAAAQAASKPVDPDKDGAWDYSAANAVGLKIALTRATGVFKGSFLAWFDYPVKKHLSKTLAYEGVLTPEREDPSDGVEGRGHFLWADRVVPPLPARPYSFKESYDFLIQATPVAR